jgi:hypothetical protein
MRRGREADIDPQRRCRPTASPRRISPVGADARLPAVTSSGKLRARQTAEASGACSQFAEFKMVRRLGPDDRRIAYTAILGESRDGNSPGTGRTCRRCRPS